MRNAFSLPAKGMTGFPYLSYISYFVQQQGGHPDDCVVANAQKENIE